jgi:IS5 family transposase
MAHQTSGQLDFADSLLGNNQKLNQRLDKINRLVDWKPLEARLSRIYSSPTGRPSHPVLLLFKSLLLQAWYNLSDYALEEVLDDRLSFRRFVGLSVSGKAPDHSVFSRFRDQLVGYKAHVGVDQDSELIGRIAMTPAHVHDGEMLGQVISGDEDWAFADKAYDSAKNEKILLEKNVKNGILMKGTSKRKLSRIEKMCNRVLSNLRSPVERVFGTLKRTYRYNRARYLSLRKNRLQLTITSMAYNIRRMGKLCA